MCLRAVLVRAPRDLAFTYVNLFCARVCCTHVTTKCVQVHVLHARKHVFARTRICVGVHSFVCTHVQLGSWTQSVAHRYGGLI